MNLTKEKAREFWRKQQPTDVALLAQYSQSICQNIADTKEFKKARQIGIFYPREWEVDLRALWKWRPEACYFPRVNKKERTMDFFLVESLDKMSKGFGNIPEPTPTLPAGKWASEDIILVPGIAFDLWGGRLGSGVGFYDRYLYQLSCLKWGVCINKLLTKERLAQEPTDVRMGALCTETGVQPLRMK